MNYKVRFTVTHKDGSQTVTHLPMRHPEKTAPKIIMLWKKQYPKIQTVTWAVV